MEVSELTGERLDYAVGLAYGWVAYPTDSVEQGSVWYLDAGKAPFGRVMDRRNFKPSTDWKDGGPILSKATTMTLRNGVYFVEMRDRTKFCLQFTGKSYLEAAMRCFVACQLGPTVNLPTEITFSD